MNLKSKAFIASVGVAATAAVSFASYAWSWPAELTAGAMSLVGALLAMWRTGVSGDPPSIGPVAIVFAALAVGGCSTTFTGATSTVRLDPVGAEGGRAELTVDGKHACEVTGSKAKLSIHREMLKRACAQRPECQWTGQ